MYGHLPFFVLLHVASDFRFSKGACQNMLPADFVVSLSLFFDPSRSVLFLSLVGAYYVRACPFLAFPDDKEAINTFEKIFKNRKRKENNFKMCAIQFQEGANTNIVL